MTEKSPMLEMDEEDREGRYVRTPERYTGTVPVAYRYRPHEGEGRMRRQWCGENREYMGECRKDYR